MILREEMHAGFEAGKNDRQAIREEMGKQYVILTSNQGVLSGKLDNQKEPLSFMQNIFTWGFAAITIGIAIRKILSELKDS